MQFSNTRDAYKHVKYIIVHYTLQNGKQTFFMVYIILLIIAQGLSASGGVKKQVHSFLIPLVGPTPADELTLLLRLQPSKIVICGYRLLTHL